jgi:hypothetical protein
VTTFAIKITDKNGSNSTTLRVSRLDFSWSGQIKTKAIASTPTGTARGTPRFLDFGRKVEGFVAYGIMTNWDEVTAIRHNLNEHWWADREARFYVTSSDYHKGQVADFKCYMDRMQGGEANIKFTLTFVLADKFFQSF